MAAVVDAITCNGALFDIWAIALMLLVVDLVWYCCLARKERRLHRLQAMVDRRINRYNRLYEDDFFRDF